MPDKDADAWLWETLSDKDWSEDFEHENGCYNCECHACGETFMGHKRRFHASGLTRLPA